MKIDFYKVTLIITGIVLLFNFSARAQNEIKQDEFKPSGKIWGLTFGDFYTMLHADSLKRGNVQYSGIPENMNAFEFRRVYLGYDYSISEKFSTEFLLAHEGQTLGDNATRTFYLKTANLRWKNIFKYNDLVIGQSATPSFPLLSEKIWGYRSVEKTIADMRKISGSNDLGISLQGRFDENANYGYNLMIGNGTGPKIELDNYRKYYGDVYAKFLNQKLIVDLYADQENIKLIPKHHKSKTTVKIFIAYQKENLTAGIEAFRQSYANSAISFNPVTLQTDTSNAVLIGYSVFLKGFILKDKLNFFARYDLFNPDTKFNSDLIYSSSYNSQNIERFVTAGLDYTPHKNVHIIPNIWYNGFYDRRNNLKGVIKKDYDLAARVTFYYIFK